jgi:hypothetical protein
VRQDSRNGYLPHPCTCLVWRQPRGEPVPVGSLTCSRVPRCEFLALNALPRVFYPKWTMKSVDLYKDHRSLWDPEHKKYRNSTRRDDSWKEITSIFIAARALGDAMVALHGLRFVLPRMLASLSETTDGVLAMCLCYTYAIYFHEDK